MSDDILGKIREAVEKDLAQAVEVDNVPHHQLRHVILQSHLLLQIYGKLESIDEILTSLDRKICEECHNK